MVVTVLFLVSSLNANQISARSPAAAQESKADVEKAPEVEPSQMDIRQYSR